MITSVMENAKHVRHDAAQPAGGYGPVADRSRQGGGYDPAKNLLSGNGEV